MNIGAARGIGKQTAITFAEAGAKVAVVDLDLPDDNPACEEIRRLGAESLPVSADISDEGQVSRIVEEVASHFGRIDVLVNNAGITRDSMVKNMSREKFLQVINVNLVGTFMLSRACAVYMKENKIEGSIINISSAAAYVGNIGQANYAASKAGIVGLGRTMAMEYAKSHIRVNMIAPGFIITDMTNAVPDKVKEKIIANIPMGVPGYPEDIADCALFLASEQAKYITGQVIHVNGGAFLS